MKKIIKKQGNSAVIRISPDEMKIYKLNLGDAVDIELCKMPNAQTLVDEVSQVEENERHLKGDLSDPINQENPTK